MEKRILSKQKKTRGGGNHAANDLIASYHSGAQ